jgi:hypothetical protein
MELDKPGEASIAMSFERLGHVLNFGIPPECSSCGLGNYNIWGTLIGRRLRVEVRCMRCGKANSSLESIIGSTQIANEMTRKSLLNKDG